VITALADAFGPGSRSRGALGWDLALATFDLDEYAYEGLRAGASGFLLKNARPDELVAGLRSVAAARRSSPRPPPSIFSTPMPASSA
jgi:DNA-binding NarL/FixJ family response regulator